MRPCVSVCIPTFNGETTLAAALDSVIAQTLVDLEVVVVDDGSTDHTVELARTYLSRMPRLRIETNSSNLGLAGNWNRCLDLANGTWVKFLFQDDLLHPACLDAMVSAGTGVDLVVCHRRARYESTTWHRRREYAGYHRWSSLRQLLGADAALSSQEVAALMARFPFVNVFAEPVAHLLRRDVAASMRYDDSMIQLLDYELAGRVALRRGLAYLDSDLAVFRVHSASATVANVSRRRFELEVVDPALLAARYIAHPDFGTLRDWATEHGVDLAALLDHRLALADQWLRRNDGSQEAREIWGTALASEPVLSSAWNPPYPPPPHPSRQGLGQRARAWIRLGVLAARRRWRRGPKGEISSSLG